MNSQKSVSKGGNSPGSLEINTEYSHLCTDCVKYSAWYSLEWRQTIIEVVVFTNRNRPYHAFDRHFNG